MADIVHIRALPMEVLRKLLGADQVREDPDLAQRIRAEIGRREKEGRW